MKMKREAKFDGPALPAYFVKPNPQQAGGSHDGTEVVLVAGPEAHGLWNAAFKGEPLTAAATLVERDGNAMVVFVVRLGAWEVRLFMMPGDPHADAWLARVAAARAATIVVAREDGFACMSRRVQCDIPPGAVEAAAEAAEFTLPDILNRVAAGIRMSHALARATSLPGIEPDGIKRTVCVAVAAGVAEPIAESQQSWEGASPTVH